MMFQANARNASSQTSLCPSGLFQKTKLCKFFKLNMCKRGESCTFAHTLHDLQPMPDLQKTKMCSKISRGRPCIDPACQYAHSRSELRAVAFERSNMAIHMGSVANETPKSENRMGNQSPWTDYSTAPALRLLETACPVKLALPKSPAMKKSCMSRQTTASSTMANTQDQVPTLTSLPELEGSPSDADWDDSSDYEPDGTSSDPSAAVSTLGSEQADTKMPEGWKLITKNTFLELASEEDAFAGNSMSRSRSCPALCQFGPKL